MAKEKERREEKKPTISDASISKIAKSRPSKDEIM
jgi:hypothetical protein